MRNEMEPSRQTKQKPPKTSQTHREIPINEKVLEGEDIIGERKKPAIRASATLARTNP